MLAKYMGDATKVVDQETTRDVTSALDFSTLLLLNVDQSDSFQSQI